LFDGSCCGVLGIVCSLFGFDWRGCCVCGGGGVVFVGVLVWFLVGGVFWCGVFCVYCIYCFCCGCFVFCCCCLVDCYCFGFGIIVLDFVVGGIFCVFMLVFCNIELKFELFFEGVFGCVFCMNV